jgi:hypothetical protein
MTQKPVDLESELEQRVDRALKRLPAPAAPPAFLSAVMRRVTEKRPSFAEAPEGKPAVFEWPVALRIALTAGGFAVIVGALVAWPLALEFARTSWQSPAIVLLVKAASAVRPMVPAALMYMTAMCVASAAAASLLKHVALGGASNS